MAEKIYCSYEGKNSQSRLDFSKLSMASRLNWVMRRERKRSREVERVGVGESRPGEIQELSQPGAKRPRGCIAKMA